ncbi:MAG: DNA polymerase IV, partial [Deltaproteobacteria bacterium]|nr:DNA polymerase IV [Deltaproteobacteria bacterium]
MTLTRTLTRTIMHADMDAFYASVEQRDDPSLRGKPVAVGGKSPRGVIAAASYEARRFGVKSAMPTTRALTACPQLTLLAPRMSHYAAISRQVFAIFRSYSPLVEGLSLDEAFVDITGTERLFGAAEDLARELKRRVLHESSLVISVGVGPSKLVAKIASDLDKPDGLRVVSTDEARAFLHALPVTRLFGVGKVTGQTLER